MLVDKVVNGLNDRSIKCRLGIFVLVPPAGLLAVKSIWNFSLWLDAEEEVVELDQPRLDLVWSGASHNQNRNRNQKHQHRCRAPDGEHAQQWPTDQPTE